MKKLIKIISLSVWCFCACGVGKQGTFGKATQRNVDTVLPNPVAGGDDYWLQPQGNFESRRNAYLSFCAEHATEGGRDGIFCQLAKLQLGQPVNEALIREGIAFVYTGKDCSDFTIGGIVRLLYLNKEKKQLSAQLVAELEKCLLDFKYWWDDPRKDIQYRCYHTENHQGLYHTDELLASQLLRNKTFGDGKTGEEHYEHARNLIDRWLVYRMRFGFSEWLSNAYYDVEMMTLANLHDFAEEPGIHQSAGQLLNGLFYDLALNNFHGVFGCTHGRTYAPMITGGWQESTAPIMKLVFGVGVFHSPKSMGAVALATSSYRCPKVIEEIATDYQHPVLSRQRQSIDVSDAGKYGLNVKDELTTHLFWGMQEFIHPDVIDMSQYISTRYNTWPYKNYEDYKLKYREQVAQFGKIVNPYLDRFALSEADIITLRTPDYMLSSVQDYRKGSPSYQQHIWQATLGVDAVVFTNHPASTELGVTPNKWAGNAILPRAAQVSNVMVCIYRIPAGTRLPYSHAYFPRNAFDEVVEKNGWTFGKKGRGYIALYSKQPVQWEAEKEGRPDELKAAPGDNIWICEMGSRSQWKDFEAFISAISSSRVKCEGLDVAYQSPSQGLVTFGWAAPFVVNQKQVDLRDFPRYGNQFSNVAFDADSIPISKSGKQVILEFESLEKALSGNGGWPAGAAPQDVGRLVANRFINTPYTNFGFKTPPSSITYSEVCAWYGALKFAAATRDHELQQRLYQRFQPLLNEKKGLVPKADHVDHTVFGTIPFELYKIKHDTALFNMGKGFADQQWQLPANAKPAYVELQDQGLTWQTRFWIDDMFMINLIQSEAYRMTGDTTYINRAAREMIEYLKRLQQRNGLFFHAPDVPFFWGRGNGWMAAGMTEILLSLPDESVYRPAILTGYQTMMRSLLGFQSQNGMWRQLIDDSTAWPETSCTGMFVYAMVTGVKHGWLDKKLYAPAARKGWLALVTYINPDGDVRDICEGTNKENNRQYYLDRKRITGDMHGQAPVLWCAAAFLSN